jgi:hypothetical protein
LCDLYEVFEGDVPVVELFAPFVFKVLRGDVVGVEGDHARLRRYLFELHVEVSALCGFDDGAGLEVLLSQPLEAVLYHRGHFQNVEQVDVFPVHLFPEIAFLGLPHHPVQLFQLLLHTIRALWLSLNCSLLPSLGFIPHINARHTLVPVVALVLMHGYHSLPHRLFRVEFVGTGRLPDTIDGLNKVSFCFICLFVLRQHLLLALLLLHREGVPLVCEEEPVLSLSLLKVLV